MLVYKAIFCFIVGLGIFVLGIELEPTGALNAFTLVGAFIFYSLGMFLLYINKINKNK